MKYFYKKTTTTVTHKLKVNENVNIVNFGYKPQKLLMINLK